MRRCESNPIIIRPDIPSLSPQVPDVTSVFNPGAVKFKDKYFRILRVQNRGEETSLPKAVSDNGRAFEIDDTIMELCGIKINKRNRSCLDTY